jgi:hypothetical protein
MGTLDRIDDATERFGRQLTQLATNTSTSVRLERQKLASILCEPESVMEWASIPPSQAVARRADTTIADTILASLYFTRIDDRERAIPNAHGKTFEWIFRSKLLKGECNNPSPATKQLLTGFPAWVEGDSKTIFWITGKPGSGKSTLLKFISHHKSLHQHLKIWAGSLPLVIAGFYSWNPAVSDMQKSREGLLRTLLFQCLKQRPALASLIAPRYWSIYTALSVRAGEPEWTWAELEQTFDRVASENGKSFRLAIFIDGLDEFEGDHRELTKAVNDLTSKYGIKTCVSSRPWNTFLDAFKHHPTIQMHELTEEDIEIYIEEQMAQAPGFQELTRLFPVETSDITKDIKLKAEGVFLWVHLVVNALLDTFAEDPQLSTIKQILRELPSDLSELYDEIWERLGQKQSMEASRLYQLFLALLRFSEVEVEYSQKLASKWTAKEYVEPDPITLWLAYTNSLKTMKALSPAQEEAAIPIIKRLLNGNTKGILYVLDLKDRSATIQFCHRTAYDWMLRNETWKAICSAGPINFDKNADLALSFMQEAQYREKDQQRNSTRWYLNDCLVRLCWFVAQMQDIKMDDEFISTLDSFSTRTGEIARRNGDSSLADVLSTSFFPMAVTTGCFSYIKAKAKADPDVLLRRYPHYWVAVKPGSTTSILHLAVEAPAIAARRLGYASVMPERIRCLCLERWEQRLDIIRFMLESGVTAYDMDIRENSNLLVSGSKDERNYWEEVSVLLQSGWKGVGDGRIQTAQEPSFSHKASPPHSHSKSKRPKHERNHKKARRKRSGPICVIL